MSAVVAGFKCRQMRSWSHSLHSLAALAVRARIPQHQSCRAVSFHAPSTTSAPKDASSAAGDSASKANIKIPELRELARPLGLPDPPRTTPLTEEEKLAKYLDPQKRLEERNHLCVVDQSYEFISCIDHSQSPITQISLTPSSTLAWASFQFGIVVSCLIG